MWANYMIGESGWGMGLYMGLFWLFALAVLGALVLSMTGWHRSHPQRIRPRKTPLVILQERYARGEIGKEEFEQKKRDLRI